MKALIGDDANFTRGNFRAMDNEVFECIKNNQVDNQWHWRSTELLFLRFFSASEEDVRRVGRGEGVLLHSRKIWESRFRRILRTGHLKRKKVISFKWRPNKDFLRIVTFRLRESEIDVLKGYFISIKCDRITCTNMRYMYLFNYGIRGARIGTCEN